VRVRSQPPLQGLKVVDLTRVLAGPFCTMLLADRGADVIKVEEPGLGDEMRGWAPAIDGWSVYFLGVNRNKRSVTLDLKTAPGAEALWRLLSGADVLVENLRPGSLAGLGFSAEAIRERNPRLIHCSISGYGLTGPRSGEAGYDPVIQAESGMMDITGSPDGPPTRMGVAMTDYLAGLYAVQGILLALMDRERTGLGQQIDISLFDTLLSTMPLQVGTLQATGTVPRRHGNDHPAIAPYEILRARDADIMVAAANPRLWRRLCEAVGAPELLEDPRYATNDGRLEHRASLKQALEAAFQRLPTGELLSRLRAAAVPCGPVRTIAEAIADPQVAARGSLVTFPDVAGGFSVPANAVRFTRIPPPETRRPPALGEHTQHVLDALGLQPPDQRPR
jgi:crotonobetainyl-CoA:carnitine CoA-transferase CaiB-like acyl-CoA transferase